MRGARGVRSLRSRKRPPSPTISISSDNDECASTPQSPSLDASRGQDPHQAQRKRRAGTNSPASGTDAPARRSKRVKVEEIDLTQDSSGGSGDEAEGDQDNVDDEEMEEAEGDEESEEEDEDESLDVEYKIPATRPRTAHATTTHPAYVSRQTHTSPTHDHPARTSDDEAELHSSKRAYRGVPDLVHTPHPHRQTRSARGNSPPPQLRRHSHEQSPPGPHHRASARRRFPSPDARRRRQHHDNDPTDRDSQHEEDKQAHAPHQGHHCDNAGNATQAQGTSSRESAPQGPQQFAPSPQPAPASDCEPLTLQGELGSLKRKNQALRRMLNEKELQNSKQQLDLRTEVEALRLANERLTAKAMGEAKRRSIVDAELLIAQATIASVQTGAAAMKVLMQQLKAQLQQAEAQCEQQTQHQRAQAQHAYAQHQADAQHRADALKHAAQQQAYAAYLQKQQQREQEQAAERAAENAAERGTGGHAEQQRANAKSYHQYPHDKKSWDHAERLRQQAAAASQAYASQYGHPPRPAPHPSQHQQQQQPSFGNFHNHIPHPPAPRTTPPVPQPKVYNADTAFSTSIPPVLDASTRIPALKQYLLQAGAGEAMNKMHEKDELLTLASSKANAWEIRRLVACSASVEDPAFLSKPQAQMAAYKAALRVPAIIHPATSQGQAIIQVTWKELRIRAHPDKNPGDLTIATAAFQFLQQAYEALASK